MWKRHVLRTFGRMASVILVTVSTIILVNLSCYREVPMPVIIEPTEDIHSGKPREQAINEGQDVRGIPILSENQTTEPLPGPKKNTASGRPKESITTEQDIGELYAIQVAAFSDLSTAKHLVQRLRTEGHPAYISPTDLRKQGKWYRVFVGNFEDKEQAALLLPKLKNMFGDSFMTFRLKGGSSR